MYLPQQQNQTPQQAPQIQYQQQQSPNQYNPQNQYGQQQQFRQPVQQYHQNQNQGNRRNDDDCCDCNDCGDCGECKECCDCGECCGDCNQCCDCDCKECGCDCLKTINTNCCQGCTCCACMACCSSGDILTELNFKHQYDEDEEESEQLIQQFKKTIGLYKIKKNIKHPHFGDCLVLMIKPTVKETIDLPLRLIMKSIWINSFQEYQSQIRFWQAVTLQMLAPGVLAVYSLYGQKIPDICVDRWRIILLIERGYQITEKSKHPFQKQIPFNTLIHQISNGLRFLHQQTGDFFKEQAFFHISRTYQIAQDQFRILPPYLDFVSNYGKDQTTSKFINADDSNTVVQLLKDQKLEGYIPTELLQENQETDLELVDVWMFGMSIISLILKQNFQDTVSPDNKLIIDKEKFKMYLDKLNTRVPYNTFIVLQKMTDFNAEQRFDFQQINQRLNQIVLNESYLGYIPENELQTHQDKSHSKSVIKIEENQMIQPRMPQLSFQQFPLASNQTTVENFKEINGGVYTGQRLNNKKHGQGRLEYRDKSGYDGQWQDNKMNGKGILYYRDGRKGYEGDFIQDSFHGFGHLWSAEKKPFNGQWNYHDLRSFEGFWDRYDGDFKMDKKHGYGILYLVNGEKWAGEFQNDIPHGIGTFYKVSKDINPDNSQIRTNEQQITGKWHRGEFVSK